MIALPALCRAIQITASQSDNVPFLQKEKYTERSSDLLYMSKKMATSWPWSQDRAALCVHPRSENVTSPHAEQAPPEPERRQSRHRAV